MRTTGAVEITSEAELRELLGPVEPVAAAKGRPSLHEHHRQWIDRSPLCLIATSAADGSCDVSPKGDPPGFAKVLDDTKPCPAPRSAQVRLRHRCVRDRGKPWPPLRHRPRQ
ncbi:pyridoxamine 5'-phosphate oxidase family protein [Streptomyces lavendulae]|uniref:pyridoxamine 5'-phosphate oxidase family protein n=1 Tax=Streptomyces lavendulae TaxID=1914 RepID=UPI0038183B41